MFEMWFSYFFHRDTKLYFKKKMSLQVFASLIEFQNVFMSCVFEAISPHFVEMMERLFYNYVRFSVLSIK